MRTQENINLNIRLLSQEAKAPLRSTEGGSIYYLYSAENVVINPFERKPVKTDVVIETPPGWCGIIVPDPQLSQKYGLDILGGFVDSNNKSAIVVTLLNLNVIEFILGVNKVNNNWFSYPGSYTIRVGDVIAQIIFKKCASINMKITKRFR